LKCLEIITLRSLAKDKMQLVDEILREVFKLKESGLPASIRVYQHPIVETDLSIHIHWEVEAQDPRESPLGQRLSYVLKGLGLVNHSLWVELSFGIGGNHYETEPYKSHG
jgi:hypothetical protein